MISNVPIVDTRADLSADQLGAPDLATLIAELPVRIALQGVGMPAGVLDPTRTVEQRVAEVIPWLAQIRTTAASWCLFRIFRDLYDFDEPHLTPANAPALIDRVARCATEGDWPHTVIQNRAKIRTVVVPAPPHPVAEPPADFVLYRLEVAPVAVQDQTPESIRVQVSTLLDERIVGRTRFVAFAEPPVVADPVHAAVLQWHHLHELPVQILLDSTPTASALESIRDAIRQYPHARLALLTSSPELAPSVTQLAARFANVFAEGYAGHGAWPATITANVATRIEQAGIGKIGGFASGAATAEWVYGALQATRKATAAALSQAVASGFFEEDELPPLLTALFSTSPTDWYRLGEFNEQSRTDAVE